MRIDVRFLKYSRPASRVKRRPEIFFDETANEDKCDAVEQGEKNAPPFSEVESEARFIERKRCRNDAASFKVGAGDAFAATLAFLVFDVERPVEKRVDVLPSVEPFPSVGVEFNVVMAVF